MTQIGVLEHALQAFEMHYEQHGRRALIPPRYNESFVVYHITIPVPSLHLPHHVATVITDAAGRVLEINAAFSEMCGYSLNELRGRKPGEVLQGPATEQEIIEQFRKAIREQAAFECTMTNYHKNGSKYRVHIKCDPVFERGRLVQFRAVETLVEPPTILLEPPVEPESGRAAGRGKTSRSKQKQVARG